MANQSTMNGRNPTTWILVVVGVLNMVMVILTVFGALQREAIASQIEVALVKADLNTKRIERLEEKQTKIDDKLDAIIVMLGRRSEDR